VINYEGVATYSVVMTVMVSDGIDWTNDTLTIEILDINEPPSFHQTKYTLEPAEEGVVSRQT